MDRSYLSSPAVVTASREFVCIRVATYEDPDEAAFTASLFPGRSGLENTVFALLEPDGETPLTRAGRSPRMALGGSTSEAAAEALLEAMASATARFGEGDLEPIVALPTALDLRRGLNVAACDLQPIAVLAVADEEKRIAARAELAKLAWSDEFIGECQYAVASTAAELATIADLPEELIEAGELTDSGTLLLVQPGQFGLTGRVLAHAPAGDAEALRAALAAGLESFEAHAKDSRRHVRDGRRAGAAWEKVVDAEDLADAPQRRRGRGE